VTDVTYYADPYMFARSNSVDKNLLNLPALSPGMSEGAASESGVTFPFPSVSVIFIICAFDTVFFGILCSTNS